MRVAPRGGYQLRDDDPFSYNTLSLHDHESQGMGEAFPELQETFSKVTEEYLEEVAHGLWDWQNESALRWAIEKQACK